jgi:chromate transporter
MTQLSDLFRIFGRIGLLSFGGPAAQIALMHRELVEERPWLSETEFLRALSFCMLLPGPEAMQLATYAGWKQRGIIGGLIGGGLFVLPGAIVIMALALLYGQFGALNWVQAVFLGVKATVVVIVIQAILRLSKKALKLKVHWLLAVGAFVSLYIFALPFPFVIAVAAIAGGAFCTTSDAAPKASINWRTPILVIVIGGILWSLPILLVGDGLLRDIGVFFSKLAVVTFGGAYAVLAYMTQDVVANYGWLSTDQMMDALGLAETTPGPLILVTQFVAIVAGTNAGLSGVAAGLMALWVTFVPCFIWIFAGAPLIDWLASRPRLSAALDGVTASVVGVIANLSVWFALHLLFGSTQTITFGPARFILPEAASLDPIALGLALFAGFLLLRKFYGLPIVLGLTGGASWLVHFVMAAT